MLRIRKLADRSVGARVPGVHPVTGDATLINPQTNAAERWPLVGVQLIGEPRAAGNLPTSWVNRAKAEGWLSLVNARPVHRPGGPAGNEWAVTHTFLHADAIVLHTVDGDVRYKVLHQPDKYAADGDDDTLVTGEVYAAGATRVDWFYGVKREG